jgi:endonuclease III
MSGIEGSGGQRGPVHRMPARVPTQRVLSDPTRISKAVPTAIERRASRTPAIMALGGYTSPSRMRRIFTVLDRLFPRAQCALNHQNPFQLLVATILSAQCTDNRVNQITPRLFQKYPTPQDFASLRPEVLARDIYSTGFFRNKAKNIVGMSIEIIQEFDSEVPRTMEKLLALPGVGRKTANVVLGTAYRIASGIVVDTHVFRVATRRLRLSRGKTPEKVEQDLLTVVPRRRWIRFSYRFTLFGRQICVARHPHCAECPLEPICDSPEKTA